MKSTEKRADFHAQQGSRMAVTHARVGSPDAEAALVSMLRSRQGTFKAWWVRRFALGGAFGLVFWVWVWGNVLDIQSRDVVALISGGPESAESHILAPLPAGKLDVASEVEVNGPSEEYSARLRGFGVGSDPTRLKDAQAIAREAFPEGW